MANTQPSVGKKRQVAKLTKRQLGYEIGRNVLNQIANIANAVRDLVEKGRAIDQRTGQPIELRCAPADITRSWSPEQHAAVEEFIATWSYTEEPLAPAQSAPKVTSKARTTAKRK